MGDEPPISTAQPIASATAEAEFVGKSRVQSKCDSFEGADQDPPAARAVEATDDEDTIKSLFRTIPVIIFVYTAHMSGSKLYIMNGYSISISTLLFYSAVAVAFINLPSVAFGMKQSPQLWLSGPYAAILSFTSSESGRLLVAGVSSLLAGFFLFASILDRSSSPTSKVSQLRYSADLPVFGSIQHDRVMICFLVPIIVQLTSAESRIWTVLCQWLIATVFASISIAWIQGWQQLWTLIYSGFFLFIYYQIDGLQKNYSAVKKTLLETQTLYLALTGEHDRCKCTVDMDIAESFSQSIRPFKSSLFRREEREYPRKRFPSSTVFKTESDGSVALKCPCTPCRCPYPCLKKNEYQSTPEQVSATPSRHETLSPLSEGCRVEDEDGEVGKNEEYNLDEELSIIEDMQQQSYRNLHSLSCSISDYPLGADDISLKSSKSQSRPRSETHNLSMMLPFVNRDLEPPSPYSLCFSPTEVIEGRCDYVAILLSPPSPGEDGPQSPPKTLDLIGLQTLNTGTEVHSHKDHLVEELSVKLISSSNKSSPNSFTIRRNNSQENRRSMREEVAKSISQSRIRSQGLCDDLSSSTDHPLPHVDESHHTCKKPTSPPKSQSQSRLSPVPASAIPLLPPLQSSETHANAKTCISRDRNGQVLNVPIPRPTPMTPLQLYNLMPVCSDTYDTMTSFSRLDGENSRILDLLEPRVTLSGSDTRPPGGKCFQASAVHPSTIDESKVRESARNYYQLPSASREGAKNRKIDGCDAVGGTGCDPYYRAADRWHSYSTSPCSSHPEDAISMTSSSAVCIQITGASGSRGMSMSKSTSKNKIANKSGSRNFFEKLSRSGKQDVGTIWLNNADSHPASDSSTAPKGSDPEEECVNEISPESTLTVTDSGAIVSQAVFARSLVCSVLAGFQSVSVPSHPQCVPSQHSRSRGPDSNSHPPHSYPYPYSCPHPMMSCTTVCGGRKTDALSCFTWNLIQGFRDDVSSALKIHDMLVSTFLSDTAYSQNTPHLGPGTVCFNLLHSDRIEAMAGILSTTRVLMVRASMSLCLATDNLTIMKNIMRYKDPRQHPCV